MLKMLYLASGQQLHAWHAMKVISKRKEIFYSIWIMLCGACGPRIKMQESQLVNTDSRVGILDRVGQLALEKSECKTQNNRLLHDSCIPVSQSWKKNDFNWEFEKLDKYLSNIHHIFFFTTFWKIN